MESPEQQESSVIPSDYAAFQDVFSKQAATKLPPHRPWDCAIDLLLGAQLPKGRVYPLSIPECKAMEDYIKEALQQWFIRPSTSPVALSFFFMWKKDGGLRPCIDYRALNEAPLSTSPGLGGPRGTPWGPHLHEAGPAECLQPRLNPGGRRVEDGVHHPFSPLWISGDAVWLIQLTVRLSGVHERGVPGVSPPIFHCVHQWYPDLLPEPGRTSPPHHIGPSTAP